MLMPDMLEDSENKDTPKIMMYRKGLGAIRPKIGPTSNVDNISSKMYSQYVLFRNKYS